MTGAEWIRWAMEQNTDDCLLCPFEPSARYPMVNIDGGRVYAHRAVFFMAGGILDDGEEVRHGCGTSRCANWRHLRAGTHSENEHDKRSHGTVRIGEAHPRARLTEDLVREIRNSDEPARTMARRLGVGRSAVRKVREGITWTHVV